MLSQYVPCPLDRAVQIIALQFESNTNQIVVNSTEIYGLLFAIKSLIALKAPGLCTMVVVRGGNV